MSCIFVKNVITKNKFFIMQDLAFLTHLVYIYVYV